MDISLWLKDWSTPLSALATLAAVIIALGLGVASIFHTQHIQKKESYLRWVIQLIEEVKIWCLEVYNIVSTSSPSGDSQETRNRIWRVTNILLLKRTIIVSAKKLDVISGSVETLEYLVNEVSNIINEHKKNPEVLVNGESGGKKIIDNITSRIDKALDILSDIKDKL